MKNNIRRFLPTYRPAEAAWVLALTALFLFSVFPLHCWFPHLARSHEWAPPYRLGGFWLVLCGCAAAGAVLYGLARRLPCRNAAVVNRLAERVFTAGTKRLCLFCFAVCFLLASIFSWCALGRIPHVQDSIAQLFQARIFLDGGLAAPAPPCPESFAYMNMIMDAHSWYSQYPPGHAALLALGLLAGAPWIINPLLAGLAAVLVYALAKSCYPAQRTAALSALLFSVSPFVLFMAASFMNHVSAMLLILLFLLLYVQTVSRPGCIRAFLAGGLLGCAALVRPLDAAALGAPFVADFVRRALVKRAGHARALSSFAVGLALSGSGLFVYNYFTTGSPLLFGYQVRHGTLGFLGTAQFGFPHTATGGLVNTSNNLIGLNGYLFAWPLPSLLLVFVLCLPRVRRTEWDRLFLAGCAALVCAYALYYYQDLCFGPRFCFSAAPLLAILTARGAAALQGALAAGGCERSRAAAAVLLLLAACVVFAIAVSMPRLYKKYAGDYWYVSSSLGGVLEETVRKPAVVFVDVSIPRSTQVPNLLAYGDGFLRNTPALDGGIVFAMDLGKKNRDVMDLFPGRRYYILTYDPPPLGYVKTGPLLIETGQGTMAGVSTGMNLLPSGRGSGAGAHNER